MCRPERQFQRPRSNGSGRIYQRDRRAVSITGKSHVVSRALQCSHPLPCHVHGRDGVVVRRLRQASGTGHSCDVLCRLPVHCKTAMLVR